MKKSLLNIFEESGREVYEITKTEWLRIKNDHMIKWYESINNNLTVKESIVDIEKRLYNDKIEDECFHKTQIERALNDDIAVSDEVLMDYIGLKDKMQAQKETERNASRLTQEIYDTLKIGDKIMVDNYKVTVHTKENNTLMLRIYKKKTKGIQLIVNDKAEILIGWEDNK